MSTKQATAQEKNTKILLPNGFQYGGVAAGIRYAKKDVGIIYSETPTVSAAVYTTNVFCAAPITVTKESMEKANQNVRAVVVNSGNANACTGEEGYNNALRMRVACAEHLQLDVHSVAIASTGVIGEQLPVEKVESGIASIQLSQSEESVHAFCESICTTDLVSKYASESVTIDGNAVKLLGVCKGSGMIHPNMATMLGFVVTDANVEKTALSDALRQIAAETFNQISVDGETSTNDMVFVMSNGNANNNPLSPTHPEWLSFYESLKEVLASLARQIARDGEGATTLIEVIVEGALSDVEARMGAKKVCMSSLVKTAVYGRDANWGRIVSAIGHSGITINPDTVDVWLGDIMMLKQSVPQPFDEANAKQYLQQDTVQIKINLHLGNGTGVAWGCDLTEKYIDINASYRS
ncbi:MAG: bifunctional glutamate N-acetyltransferase/amino-acid acetyltransferase ArgJ [Bacilli bacterium]